MIRTKKEFYAEQRAERCGNYYPQFYSYAELLEAGYTGLVSVRDLTKGGRSKTTREIHKRPVDKIPSALRCKDAGVAFIPTPRDDRITFQGEYSEDGGQPELRYTHVKLPMLYAFKKQSLRAVGYKARLLVQHFMDPASLETLYELTDKHTSFSNVYVPTIEFTCYDVAVGAWNRNTVFWEVRNY
jgi:hypothetical protein